MSKCLLYILLALQLSVQAQKFKVSYSSASFKGPFSGKVLLYLSKETMNPKDATAGSPKIACFSINVKNIVPGSFVLFDDKAISFPVILSDLERGEYYVQAVWDRNSGGRNIGNSPDNMYSSSGKYILTKNTTQVFTINCKEFISSPLFQESKFAKELKVNSSLLSNFYKRTTSVNAAVVLPKEYYDEPLKKFPVLFEVSGYGGDYHYDFSYMSNKDSTSRPLDSVPCIYVFLDGNCSWGHSVYANSDNNGPWGDALVKEFIPALEKTYRCDGGRLLTGHSSGGWSVAWLQLMYPETFTACWSSSPDPVDFRNFSGIDIYSDKSMFYHEDSSLTALAVIGGGIPWIYSKEFYSLETVLYRGEQLHSFDAVFSKKNKNGNPEKICNYYTGVIDTAVSRQWQQYDISYLIRNNLEKYKPAIDGRLRMSVGKQDNFHLNRAVKLLETETKKLGLNIEYSYYPGDHFTIATKDYFETGYHFLKQKYMEWLSKNVTQK